MAKEILEMLVESATMELPDTKTLKLKWPDGHNPEFKTGQFITLYWPDTTNYKRAYSLYLTNEGRKQARRGAAAQTQVVGETLGRLTPSQLAQMDQSLLAASHILRSEEAQTEQQN